MAILRFAIEGPIFGRNEMDEFPAFLRFLGCSGNTIFLLMNKESIMFLHRLLASLAFAEAITGCTSNYSS
jgi:hypothetical protein